MLDSEDGKHVRIGPYILFSNCKWHRRCRPTDEN